MVAKEPLFIQKLNDLAIEFIQLPDKFKCLIGEALDYMVLLDTQSYDDIDISDIENIIWTNVLKDDNIHKLDELVGFYAQRSV